MANVSCNPFASSTRGWLPGTWIFDLHGFVPRSRAACCFDSCSAGVLDLRVRCAEPHHVHGGGSAVDSVLSCLLAPGERHTVLAVVARC